jgi:hypothetical protein
LQHRRGREGQELVRLGEHRREGASPAIQPTFQPVAPKILPAEPILIVRSAMPGSASSERVRRPSKRTASPDLVADGDKIVLAGDPGEERQLLRRWRPSRWD